MKAAAFNLNDPEQREEFRRLTLGQFVGRTCAYCRKRYTSIDDFLARDPRTGHPGDIVDAACWEAYTRS